MRKEEEQTRAKIFFWKALKMKNHSWRIDPPRERGAPTTAKA